MKKRFFLSVSVICLVILSLILYSCQGAAGRFDVVIGVISPLTGNASAYGNWVKQGMQFAVEDLEREGSKIKLIFEDDQANPQKALTAYNKLVTIDKVKYIVCAMTSSNLAIKESANRDKVIVFTPVASHPDVTKQSMFFFRNVINSAQEADVMIKFVQQTNPKMLSKIAIVYVNDPGGLASKDAFSDYLRKLAKTPLSVTPYEKGKFDFRDEAYSVLSKKPAAIYLTGYGREMGAYVNSLRSLQANIPIFTNQGIENKDALGIAGKYANGIYYTHFPPAVRNKFYESLIGKWHAAGNSGDPGMTVVAAYDAVLFLSEAAKKTTTVEQAADYLRAHSFNGAAGETKFTESGDRQGAIAIKEILNGEGKYVEVTDDTNR